VAVVDPIASEAPGAAHDTAIGAAGGSASPGDAERAVEPAVNNAILPASRAPVDDGSVAVPVPAVPAAHAAVDAAAVEVPAPAVPGGKAAVDVLPVETPVPAGPSGHAAVETRSLDVPAPKGPVDRGAPHVELVRRDEHELRPAGDASGLVVFSRVVAPPASAPRDPQRLVTEIAESEPVLDQLRSLAASLHQARTGRELRVIAVTSSVSGEGKTLLAANLALTLSRSYMRQVLLIDADLRRPGLHRVFGTSAQSGVHAAMEAVREGSPVSVQEVAPRLALLPAGRPVRDPISVLASDGMQRLVASANAAFDWVIVDTPPVGMLPDMSLLGSLSDAVLLVVEAGRVRYDLVQRTVETIGADRIFGVVLNKVPEHDIVASYGMHYYAPYR
jgi:capsular exopolysaccharide synthesis family protein